MNAVKGISGAAIIYLVFAYIIPPNHDPVFGALPMYRQLFYIFGCLVGAWAGPTLIISGIANTSLKRLIGWLAE